MVATGRLLPRNTFWLFIGQRGMATGWTRLASGTLALSTYHDVVPATDGFPLIPQEIALSFAFPAPDGPVGVTDVAIYWLRHSPSLSLS